MKTWTNTELDTVGKADELQIASLRKDGTLRSYRIIWVVRVGDDLYVRSVNGRDSDWFRGVRTRHEGRIQADGIEKDAAFVEITDAAVHQEIDSAYRAKYGHYPKEYVDNCLTPKALAATIKLVPRE
jgi:hypothetical protein